MTLVTAHKIFSEDICIVIVQTKKDMKKNLGTADKIIRVIIAVVIGLLYFTNVIAGTLGIVLLVIAGVFLLTSIVGFCPLYAPFGINTCPSKR